MAQNQCPMPYGLVYFGGISFLIKKSQCNNLKPLSFISPFQAISAGQKYRKVTRISAKEIKRNVPLPGKQKIGVN